MISDRQFVFWLVVIVTVFLAAVAAMMWTR